MIHFTHHRTMRVCGAGFAAAILLALAPASHAQPTLFYKVTLNVGSLETNLDAPFSLDLQLISGSQNVTNSVAIGNFTFNNTSLTGSVNTAGLEGGSTSNYITLTTNPSNGFSEFYQQLSITNSTASVSFVVAQSMNNELVGSGTPAPDQFQVFLDDSNTSDGYVPTNAPGSPGPDYLVDSVISSTETEPQVQGNSYSSLSPDSGVTTAVAVPEPGSAALLLLGVAGLVARRKRAVAPHAA